MKNNILSITPKMLINGILLWGILVNCSAQQAKNKTNPENDKLIFGTVVSDSGKTISGAKIVLSCARYNKKGVRIKDEYYTVNSDSNGYFAINLPVIPSRIKASKPDYFPTTIEKFDTTEVLNGINLTLISGGKIRIVVDGLPRNELESLDIKAFAQGRAYADNDSISLFAPLGVNPATGHLEANYALMSACYWIEWVPSGDCEIKFKHRGKIYSRQIKIAGGTVNDVSFDLKPTVFTLSGNVTEHGNPIAGYFLTFQLMDENIVRQTKGYFTDQNGRYIMKLDSGMYKIEINASCVAKIQGANVKAYEAIYSTSYSLVKNDTLNFELDDLILIDLKENE